MGEQGVLDAAKEGAIFGSLFGFTVGSSRVYLKAREYAEAQAAMSKLPAGTKPSPALLRIVSHSPLAQIGTTSAMYAGLGAVFTGVGVMTGNVRGKDDVWNQVCGALAAGALVGVRAKSVHIAGGVMASTAAASLAYGLLGEHIGPPENDPISARHRAIFRE